MLTSSPAYPYLFAALISFLINVLLGYLREAQPKFSAKWFLKTWVSFPFIIGLLILWEMEGAFFLVCLFMAVDGQILGGYWRKQRLTVDEVENIQQIPDLRLPKNSPRRIADQEVMVTLLNMGGPKTNADVPDFLRRIFLDPHIIRFPLSGILQSFFAWMLVTVRAKAVAERYHLIGGGSPIYPSTEKQVMALQTELVRRGRKLSVTYSFNYSKPLPEETIAEIKAQGKKYLLPLSMYPHYSRATTGSNMIYLRQAAAPFPELQFLPIPSYYLHPRYIDAFVDRIREQIKQGESLDEFYILFSAHGLPLYFLTEGDTYPFQIAQTVAAVLAKLNRHERWMISYQSDVGPLQWLKPSTENMLAALARRGIKKLLVVPISFVNDHIETLCEIDIEYRKVAEDDGITDYRMSKAIETHPGFIQALADAVENILPR